MMIFQTSPHAAERGYHHHEITYHWSHAAAPFDIPNFKDQPMTDYDRPSHRLDNNDWGPTPMRASGDPANNVDQSHSNTFDYPDRYPGTNAPPPSNGGAVETSIPPAREGVFYPSSGRVLPVPGGFPGDPGNRADTPSRGA
jgi:hypothetical protein